MAIIGVVFFLIGTISKLRWMNLIAVFLILVAVWLVISKFLTGM